MDPIDEGRAQRLPRLQQSMTQRGLDALVCTRNLNLLLVGGWCPVAGIAVALVTPEPRVVLVVPEEAAAMAACGWADEVRTFASGSLERIEPVPRELTLVLESVLRPVVRPGARVGVETGPGHMPATYASLRLYGEALSLFLRAAFPDAGLVSADGLLRALRACPTPYERARIRAACLLAARAYEHGVPAMAAGDTEQQVAASLRHAYGLQAGSAPGVAMADAFFYCMSGPNAARAWGAFQASGRRRLERGEPVVLHCNAHADGYWTDLTRTYAFGEPDQRLATLWRLLAEARAAALDLVRPGVPASEVDRAVRSVLARAGYGEAFRHPAGHGVGFTAIDHAEPPCIHPANDAPLEEGMVFNIEPGAYLDAWGGARDCNLVAVTGTGCELLSPFHLEPADWRLA